MTYINQYNQYTDPAKYDERNKSLPIERYIQDLWVPKLKHYLKNFINKDTTICDLGCGTLEHTRFMGKARKIYAVDCNQTMLDYGKHKIENFKDKVNVLCNDALNTTLPNNVCNIVWTVGLTEYVSVENLFEEINRILHSGGYLLIQFPNQFHPYHLAVSIRHLIFRNHSKKYSSLMTIKNAASKYNFQIVEICSLGVYMPLPRQNWHKYFLPLWRIIDWFCRPLQRFFPIGANVFCVFKKY